MANTTSVHSIIMLPIHIVKVLANVHCVVARATTVQVVTGVDLCHNLNAFK